MHDFHKCKQFLKNESHTNKLFFELDDAALQLLQSDILLPVVCIL